MYSPQVRISDSCWTHVHFLMNHSVPWCEANPKSWEVYGEIATRSRIGAYLRLNEEVVFSILRPPANLSESPLVIEVYGFDFTSLPEIVRLRQHLKQVGDCVRENDGKVLFMAAKTIKMSTQRESVMSGNAHWVRRPHLYSFVRMLVTSTCTIQ